MRKGFLGKVSLARFVKKYLFELFGKTLIENERFNKKINENSYIIAMLNNGLK